MISFVPRGKGSVRDLYLLPGELADVTSCDSNISKGLKTDVCV